MYTCTCVDRASDDHLPYDYISFIVHADVYIHVHNVKNVFSQNTEENSESIHAQKCKVMAYSTIIFLYVFTEFRE